MRYAACGRARERFMLALMSSLSMLMPAQLIAETPSEGETPRHYCARVGDDDKLRSAPSSLADPIERLFGVSGGYAFATTYYRCAGGEVLLCNIGANLPCGKANTSTELPAANEWCRTNQNSDFIPMFVTGHDTIYDWRCTGAVAKPVKKIGAVDGRGFFAQYWKGLP